jgi:hypothetical protein
MYKLPFYHLSEMVTIVDNENSDELIFEGGEEAYNEGRGGTETSITPSTTQNFLLMTFFIRL